MLAHLPVALPVTAQPTLGLRAGLGIARMAGPLFGGINYAPCPPETDCPRFPDDGVRGPSFGADINLRLRKDGRLDVRFGGGHARNGGGASGFDARGDSFPGELSVSYLHLQALFHARTYEPHTVARLR